MLERFDARDENCIPLSIDKVTLHIRGYLYNKEKIGSIKKMKQMIDFFSNQPFMIRGFFHPIFYLNPLYVKLFYKYKFKPISFLISEKSVVSNSAYMFFLCGNDLYGIPEFWNHMVVELFGKTEKERVYYDSYFEIVKKDYPNLNIKKPTHRDLIKKMTICLIIRRM